LGPDAKLELNQRQLDAHHPFLVKRMSWSWFSAELVRVQPTEFEFRVKGDAAYLAPHDYVRSDGETTINGGTRSTLIEARDKLTFAPIGSSVEGWNCFKRRVSSAFAVHLAPPTSGNDANDISKIPPSLYFEQAEIPLIILCRFPGPALSIDCRRGARTDQCRNRPPSARLHLPYIGTTLAEVFHSQYATYPSISLN
jgi:hypothetical protein